MKRIILITMATMACARAAFAQQLPIAATPAEPARPVVWSPSPAHETRVLFGQVAAGAMGIALVGAVGVSMFQPDDDSATSVSGELILLTAPLAAGLAVCSIGRFSAYESSCGYSGLGAYMGALVGGYVGYVLASRREYGPGDGPHDGSAYLLVGTILGATIGATFAWHLGKHPPAGATKAPAGPPPPPVADAWPEIRRRPALGTTEPGARRIVFPLLALSFQ